MVEHPGQHRMRDRAVRIEFNGVLSLIVCLGYHLVQPGAKAMLDAEAVA